MDYGINKLGRAAAAAVLALLSLAAQAAAPEKTELTFSRSSGPAPDLFITAVQPILERQGYRFKAVDLSDMFQTDVALNDGEVDFNVQQHTAYMNHFNKTQDGRLVALTPIPTVYAGIYPGAKKDLKDVEDGDHIAIPNDASNAARCLLILQKAGLVKFDPKKDIAAVSVHDIVENPKNLKFTEMKDLNIPAVATDFDYIILPGPAVYTARIDPGTALVTEDLKPHLILHLVVREEDRDTKWAQDIVNAYNSDEFRAYMENNNDGLWYVPDAQSK